MEKIKYRILGKSGLSVSIVGLGGIPLQRIDVAQTIKIVDALEAWGVNFIDSARGYSVSEEYIGAALKGRREKFILATKSMARTYEAMQKDIEISLKNLQTDYIDLYQLHNVGADETADVFGDNGAVKAILEAIEKGEIRHLGATVHTLAAFEKLLEYPQIETIMFPFNFVETEGKDLMQKARGKNVGFIAMKPLAGGNIGDGRLAMRYVLNDEDCTIVIPGMASLEEVAENLQAATTLSGQTREEKEKMKTISASLAEGFCRRCGYCAPCEVGIDIPGCFILANYMENYQLSAWAKSRYSTFKVYASACIGCGKCESRCPYNLPIQDKMKHFARIFGK